MPDPVQQVLGFALYNAQIGLRHPATKPQKGFCSAVVIEVYVLHCFQKKSKQGIQTPKHEIELIRGRLKEAEMRVIVEKP